MPIARPLPSGFGTLVDTRTKSSPLFAKKRRRHSLAVLLADFVDGGEIVVARHLALGAHCIAAAPSASAPTGYERNLKAVAGGPA